MTRAQVIDGLKKGLAIQTRVSDNVWAPMRWHEVHGPQRYDEREDIWEDDDLQSVYSTDQHVGQCIERETFEKENRRLSSRIEEVNSSIRKLENHLGLMRHAETEDGVTRMVRHDEYILISVIVKEKE